MEADETFIGHDKAKKPPRSKAIRGTAHKYTVLALVDRDTGRSRHIIPDDLKADPIADFVRQNVAKEAVLMTDESRAYRPVGREFASHKRVNHGAGEYVNQKIARSTRTRLRATSPSSSAA